MTNLDKKIINIKTREPYLKSFISEDEKMEIVAAKIAEKDMPETVGNVILNCLMMIPGETKLDGFYANAIAQIIFGNEREVELNEKFKKFLISHLDKSILRIVKTKDKEELRGLYAGWIIAQVLEEIGEKLDVGNN